MTFYEFLRTLAIPVLPVLHGRAHGDLRRLIRHSHKDRAGKPPLRLLDIGGRSSPYTTCLKARITLLDLPRESEVQEDLALGIDQQVLANVRRRRSNIDGVILEDMCRSTLADDSFDAAVAVEVLEHVPDDSGFLAQIARVVRPGGWFYLTTPNGEWVKHEETDNPDHLRHYTRAELTALLEAYFDDVRVVYAVRTGKQRWRGLKPFNFRRPGRLLMGMASNVVNHWQSRGLDDTPRRTAHLIGIARVSKRDQRALKHEEGRG